MTCDAVRELLSAYLDNELDAGERPAVEGHLKGCAACAAELEALRRTVHFVRRLPREAAPADFARRVAAALPSVGATSGRDLPGSRPAPPSPSLRRPGAPPAPLRFPRYVLPLAAAASIAIVVGVALLARQESESARGVPIASGKSAPTDRRTVDAAKSPESRDEAPAYRTQDAPAVADARRNREGRADKAPDAAPAAPPVFAQAPEKSEAGRGAHAEEQDLKKAEGLLLRSAPAAPAAPPPAAAEAPRPSSPPASRAAAPSAPADAFAAEPKAQSVEQERTAPAPGVGGAAQAKMKSPPAPAAASPAPARQMELAAPVVVLALHGGDPARQARVLDELAYVESREQSVDAKARKGLERARDEGVRRAEAQKEPISVVYDLTPDAAARFMERLAARRDLRVTVEQPPQAPVGREDAPMAAFLDGVRKLGGEAAPEEKRESDQKDAVALAEARAIENRPAASAAPKAVALETAPSAEFAQAGGEKAANERADQAAPVAQAAAAAAPGGARAPAAAPAPARPSTSSKVLADRGPAKPEGGAAGGRAPKGGPAAPAPYVATGDEPRERRVRIVIRLVPQ